MKLTKSYIQQIIQEELKNVLSNRKNLSKGLRHHVSTKTPLTENVYRIGSDAYFNLIKEASTK